MVNRDRICSHTTYKLKNQKDVVRNERRQRNENQPFGEVFTWLFENLYPQGHPYHIPTIGKHEDIENAKILCVILNRFQTLMVLSSLAETI